MEISDVLNQTGLNQKQAGVYLALLELGTASVQLIAAKAGLKRPTTYLILDELQQKGIVSIIPRAKKALYTAESPEKLIYDLRKKEELLKSTMPNLLALFNAKKEKPNVQLFEGKEGVKQIYQKIYSANEVWFFGTPADALKVDPETLVQFLKRAQEINLTVRDVMGYSKENLEYAKIATKDKNYQARFLPNEKNFLTDNAIFGDTVVFFSFRPTIFAVSITSKEISHAIKILFEFAWESAEPYEKVIKKQA